MTAGTVDVGRSGRAYVRLATRLGTLTRPAGFARSAPPAPVEPVSVAITPVSRPLESA
jgi:hypothetical protein